MSFTLGDISTEVALELEGRSDDDDYNTLLMIFANDAHGDVQFECRWHHNINAIEPLTITVAAGADYEVSTTVGELTGCRDKATDREIYFRTIEQIYSDGFDLESSGQPYYFVPMGYNATTKKYKIKFVLKPNQNYDLEFTNFKQWTILTPTAGVPLPDEFKSVIKDKVRAYAYALDDRVQPAKLFLQEHYIQLEKRRVRAESNPAWKRYRPVQDIPRAVEAAAGIRLPPGYTY